MGLCLYIILSRQALKEGSKTCFEGFGELAFRATPLLSVPWSDDLLVLEPQPIYYLNVPQKNLKEDSMKRSRHRISPK